MDMTMTQAASVSSTVSSTVAVTQVHPGVWRVRLGEPEKITPISLREIPANESALAKMSAVTPPACLTGLTWECTTRGLLLSIPLTPDEELYGLGLQLKSLAQRGKRKTLRVNSDPVADTGDSHAPVPFICSTAGWGLLVDTARYATFNVGSIRPAREITKSAGCIGASPAELYSRDAGASGGVVVEIPHVAGCDLYFFSGPTLRDTVARYNLFSGGGCRPSLKGLGVWYRAYGKANRAEIEQLVTTMQSDGIPCDVLGLEPGWQTSAYPCSFVWSDDRFPQHRDFLAGVHVRGLHINCWEHAFTQAQSPIAPALAGHVGPSAVFNGLMPDLLRAPARAAFVQHHAQLVHDGIDGFKLDECDSSDFISSPWSFPEHDRFPSGIDGECMHSLFGISYQRTIHQVLQAAGRRACHSVRNSHALAAPYPFVLYSDLYELKDFIRGVATASFSGLLWTPEVRDATTTEELIRRVQAVALSPQALINAWYIPLPPWQQINLTKNLAGECMPDQPQATALVRDALRLRMRLLPYLDAAFAHYEATGIPPCRALAMDYPDDLGCRTVDDQWLLGADLLVAPMLPGQTQRAVVLPPGRWYPLAGGPACEGGQTITISVPLDLLPVFVRDGAVLPLVQVLPHVDPSTCFEITAVVFGDGRHGAHLIEDDGEHLAAESNHVHLSWNGTAVELTRTGAWSGRRFTLAGWEVRL